MGRPRRAAPQKGGGSSAQPCWPGDYSQAGAVARPDGCSGVEARRGKRGGRLAAPGEAQRGAGRSVAGAGRNRPEPAERSQKTAAQTRAAAWSAELRRAYHGRAAAARARLVLFTTHILSDTTSRHVATPDRPGSGRGGYINPPLPLPGLGSDYATLCHVIVVVFQWVAGDTSGLCHLGCIRIL